MKLRRQRMENVQEVFVNCHLSEPQQNARVCLAATLTGAQELLGKNLSVWFTVSWAYTFRQLHQHSVLIWCTKYDAFVPASTSGLRVGEARGKPEEGPSDVVTILSQPWQDLLFRPGKAYAGHLRIRSWDYRMTDITENAKGIHDTQL